MVNQVLLVISLIFIGAVIGGGTNIIAIRMLFRPYFPKYIGSFRVPLTPGLIPKRRAEIANSLGEMVEDHLFTPEGIQEKLNDGLLLKEVEKKLSEAVDLLFQDERTLDEWIELHFQKQNQMKNYRESAEKTLQTKLWSIICEFKDSPISEWLPRELSDNIEAKIPLLSDEMIKKTEDYLKSDQGREQVDDIMMRFFMSKGSITSMFGKMANRFSLSNAITKEMQRFLHEEHTKKLLTKLLKSEWDHFISKPPSEYMNNEKLEKEVNSVSKTIISHAPVIGEWEQPLKVWSIRYEKMIKYSIIPAIMASASSILSRYLKSLIKKVGIHEIVTSEVNRFPLARLEQMLLMIARRELKMIAVLGAVIGALIGLIQGIFIVFFL